MTEPGKIHADAERQIDTRNAEEQERFLDEFGDPTEMLAQPGLQPVLGALSPDYTMWQKAFWLVSQNKWLGGETALEAVQSGEIGRVIEAARLTREERSDDQKRSIEV